MLDKQIDEYKKAQQLLRGLVGSYTELIPEASDEEARLCAIAYWDEKTGLCGEPVPREAFEDILKNDKDYEFITSYYLYCNWRVWATYKHNTKLAARYQKVCDEIDGYIFDNYDKEAIRYFVAKTD